MSNEQIDIHDIQDTSLYGLPFCSRQISNQTNNGVVCLKSIIGTSDGTRYKNE